MADSLFEELKRRNVFKVAIGYLVLAWVVIQVTDSAVPALHLPSWVNSVVFYFGLIVFPFVLFFSWVFELTPNGVMRQSDIDKNNSITLNTGRKLDYAIILLLIIALSYFFWESRFANNIPLAQTPTLLETNKKAAQQISIAVLPFVDMSPDKDQEYFSDGMSEEILNGLVKLPKIKVAGRTSSFAYKGKNTDLREIGKELNVSTILEGSVRKSGLQLRITAQLINAENGYHLWSETYDRKLTDVFIIQDEITTAIITALKVHLTPEDIADKKSVTTIAGYTSYMKARHELRKRTPDSLQLAADFFQETILLDPLYAPALSGYSRAMSLLPLYSNLKISAPKAIEEARKSAQQALNLNKNNGEAYSVLGYISLYYDFDWQKGERELQKSLMLNPNDSEAYNFLGDYYRTILNLDLAHQMESKALSLDPLFWVNNNELAQVYAQKKDWVNVIKYCQKSLALYQKDLLCHLLMIESYMKENQTENAALYYRNTIKDDGYFISNAARLQFDIFYAIQQKEIQKVKQWLIKLEELVIKKEVSPSQILFFYTLMKDYKKLNIWLDYAITHHDLNLIYYGTLLLPEQYPKNLPVQKKLTTPKFQSFFTLWRINIAKNLSKEQ